ncbi:MAG: SDR family NAD(P)-dependent oxidoreductase [Gammaproteobacteria bacterium]|nr:SDR family NAD(P)-dependent oxidoreductase [Gammaproteobacteria bacterium]MCW8987435.1 SDR family NAD(P)-dependent oxidoreductase [Gammaproteobacteria bacterium]
MKTILITGARGGIGLDAAKRLLDNGHIVYATVHLESDVAPLKETLSAYGERAIIEKLDILEEHDREKVNQWDIDVLINNAAIGDSGPLADIPAERVRNVIETNVVATLQITQVVLKQMKQKQQGRVIFISSLAGMMPTPFLSPYSLTKHALESITGSLRGELHSYGIDVVSVNPGGYNTGFNKKNIEKKYQWLDKTSMSTAELKRMKFEESVIYRFEMKSTNSIAKKIVKAVEANRPARRYIAPWWQGLGVFFIRLFN